MRLSRRLLLIPVVSLPLLSLAAPEPPKSDYNPPLAAASDDAERSIARFQRDKSLKIEVWAAEPMLAHPVAFAFDEKGACYVAETFRMHHGVTDTRGHMYWLDDDLACRTVADRVAKYKKHAGKKFHETYEKDRERVRRLEDTNGDGKADRSTVFLDDFGRAEDGVGAGLLARKGNVYFTCIPDLWLLKDTKGTGAADVKQSLSTGYGVHTAFIGHDLHGLCVGPDGRLYFSVGDRGLNVKTREGKHLYCPDSGAVLRCELDGSNLEIFATGLRNPQELAFDDYGNLFTVDNNSDSGDQARFVHVVEGGDSGWRIGYQYETRMHDSTVKQGNRGPWNYEQLWTPNPDAAYVVPPIRNFSNGPSGFAAYPGVGLSDKYKGHFFLANFSGGPGNSGIFSFGIKPRGASFEMTDDHRFVWDVLATDCEFGPDGAFYLSDWVDGWNINGKGRIYKVADPVAMKDPAVAEARRLLGEGVEKKSIEELIRLLSHKHRGVRLEAQFALAARRLDAINALRELAMDPKADVRARIHAIWAATMIGRHWMERDKEGERIANRILKFMPLLADPDPEIRTQMLNLTADTGIRPVTGIGEYELLEDPSPRVQLSAALSIARMGGARPLNYPPEMEIADARVRDRLFVMARENGNRDAVLRHAAAYALAECIPSKLLLAASENRPPAVRLAAAVALRRQRAPEIAAFLTDSDPGVVAEAARAINDEVIPAALPKLAALSSKADLPRVVAFRALNAHFLLGQRSDAAALAAFAARSDAPTPLRALAVLMLGDWPKPPRRDYITGLTQDLPARPKADAAEALGGVLEQVFAGPDALRKEAVAAVRRLELSKASPYLIALVGDSKAVSQTRIDALTALASLGDPRLLDAARTAVASNDANVRSAGRGLLYRKDPAGVMEDFRAVLTGSNVAEQQGTFALFTVHPSPEADALIEEWLDKVIASKAASELMLEILEAAKASKSERIRRRLAGFENARSKDELGKFREVLAGGNLYRGREIFLNKAEVQCQRCHKLGGQGGDVGPPANGVGKQTREYLLESIVLPSKTIAKGYESVLITTLDNKTVSGVLKSEDENEVRLVTAEGKPLTVLKADIDDRRATKSAMPDDLAPKLSKRELRDLIEFLSRLKEEWKKP